MDTLACSSLNDKLKAIRLYPSKSCMIYFSQHTCANSGIMHPIKERKMSIHNKLNEKMCKYVLHINALMYSAVSLEDEQASIFQKLVSQRNGRKVSFFKPLS